MKKLTTFVASCILLLSMSVVVLADGGIAQTPGKDDPPPPPSNYAVPSDTGSEASTESQVIDVQTEFTSLLAWLSVSIL